jgi:hypothetical protein
VMGIQGLLFRNTLACGWAMEKAKRWVYALDRFRQGAADL